MLRTALAAAALVGLIGVTESAAECEKASATRGKKLFAEDCGHCHGTQAEGGGTMAEKLDSEATDLTHLSADNDGKFPEKAVRGVVDGRDVPEHISNDMPAWGINFHMTADNEDEVVQRICDLVAYVRSIQK